MKFIKEKELCLSRFTLESFNAYIALSERAAASALLDIQKALRPFKRQAAMTNEKGAMLESALKTVATWMLHDSVGIVRGPMLEDRKSL